MQVKLAIEEEGLFLANDEVILINMELGIIKKFQRSPEGFTVIPRDMISVPSVLIVRDGSLRKFYVVSDITKKEVVVEQVRSPEVMKTVTEGHIISLLAGEVPCAGTHMIQAISYLRSL